MAGKRRPHVLWLMSDQHNVHCSGYMGHHLVKTPNLDRIAENGVNFKYAFAANPICSPSRISFMTGQHCHTHGYFGNRNNMVTEPNPNTMACLFRNYGYQTALIGKSHMIRKWDQDGFERIRYTDLADGTPGNPEETHYFKYLVDQGLADLYEEGNPKEGQFYTMDGSGPAKLPYEHSIERFTGRESLKFLDERDENRPFFLKMSFQRPHAPIAPAQEHFGMYDPKDVVFPDNAVDWFERKFAGKPKFIQERLKGGCDYPLAHDDPNVLRQVLASYYALITVIDMEIGHVLKKLEEMGELDNTIIFYTADHGDFGGEHGLFHKNLGCYDAIARVPFIFQYPGGPKNTTIEHMVEAIDIFPTLCQLCHVPAPDTLEGQDLLPLMEKGETGKNVAFTDFRDRSTSIRTPEWRCTYFAMCHEGELYDHKNDPGELNNLWDSPEHQSVKMDLLTQLLRFNTGYETNSHPKKDQSYLLEDRYSPTHQLHKEGKYWSDLLSAYETRHPWPRTP